MRVAHTDAYSLRELGSDDGDLVYSIIHATMAQYVEQVYGPWIETEQRKRIGDSIDRRTHRILVVQCEDAGLLIVDRQTDHIQLEGLFILAEHQRRGLGARVVTDLKQEAKDLGVPLCLRVFQCNPAKHFYLREGFVVEKETPERWFMAYS